LESNESKLLLEKPSRLPVGRYRHNRTLLVGVAHRHEDMRHEISPPVPPQRGQHNILASKDVVLADYESLRNAHKEAERLWFLTKLLGSSNTIRPTAATS
jgi:hypothetical protein